MSYPKITFGPFIERPDPTNKENSHWLDVFFQTNGDWRGTDEGCMELQVALSMMLEQTGFFPRETEFHAYPLYTHTYKC